ncbi:MgtC/SapB family protein [Atopomonas sediminilitoris]|uniref:MgtC/SapB family protein n=1 Tax=Atopomonas sediminilitoris TaxID=2919919 RepID=UPI001F4EE37B|nr:MgtC/SapB family protein [Atopomonas sediminilitoris]MCJ8169275.1 MgtC/SapB family protein [Atopomonas sediminilitoris]
MHPLSPEMLLDYWSLDMLQTNLLIVLHLLGALFLGCIVGYERAYRGRAAGMRTYGLVCMASAALTVLSGLSSTWYGGHGVTSPMGVDPTRVIQGVVTGIGFLGAGVIMKTGLNISGLTTAASIWASSAIGVLVGVGFYTSALLMALLAAASMMGLARLEMRLPQRPAIGVQLLFEPQFAPKEGEIRAFLMGHGFDMAMGSVAVSCKDAAIEWRFVAVAHCRRCGTPMIDLAQNLREHPGVHSFHISHARN